MQGWRKKMEDSHICDINLIENNLHIFGIFDGHGGDEVAQYIKKNFTEEIKKNSLFKSGDIENSLIENFLYMDELLNKPEGKSELRKFYKISKEKEKENLINSKYNNNHKNYNNRDKHLDINNNNNNNIKIFDPKKHE
jgi:hypothetical protein